VPGVTAPPHRAATSGQPGFALLVDPLPPASEGGLGRCSQSPHPNCVWSPYRFRIGAGKPDRQFSERDDFLAETTHMLELYQRPASTWSQKVISQSEFSAAS